MIKLNIGKTFVLGAVTSLLSIQAVAEKTVCSITLNSSDEIEAMKMSLPAQDFKFVELVQKNRFDWFKQACQSKVQCDVLVISGHFAGTFFGETGAYLKLKDLEESSCDPGCSGIYKNVKEVYLFGCNTLAGKEKDHRTPEQYLQVLLNDGFNMAHAQQAVAYRYSPIGATFSNRMAHVFSKTPRIYGFYSTSPLGKYTGPKVKSYFSKRLASNQYATEIENLSTDRNQELMSLFKGTSLTQVAGSQISDSGLTPVCYLSDFNKSSGRIQKLQWINNSFNRSSSLDLINYVAQFLKNEESRRRWDNDEKQIIEQIAQNQALKTQLFDIVNSQLNWLKQSVLEILEFSKVIGWISEGEYDSKVIELLELYKSNFGSSETDFACAINISANLKKMDFNKINWNNEYLKTAIKCLNPKNPSLNSKLYPQF